MLETLRHEPFYVSGELAAPELGVWAGWMAHPHSFASAVSGYQDPDGSALLFCGECFPSADGFSSVVLDTPERFAAAVIAGCREQGIGYLRRLNGLFSGIVIDRTRRSCLVFNDRFGSERLYRHQSGDTVWLASEAKAVLHATPDVRQFDVEAVSQYIRYGSVLDGRTLFRGVEVVPGGSAIFTSGPARRSSAFYFTPKRWEAQVPHTSSEFAESLGATLKRVVPRYVRSDESVGISITGGLDTRMIMAALPGDLPAIRCYTYGGFSGETLDEAIGRDVALRCGLPHETLRLDRAWLDRFADSVDRTVWISDGCAGVTTAHEIHFSGLARHVAAVRLTGNYGSEVLRGMSTLKPSAPVDGFLAPGFEREVLAVKTPDVEAHPITQAAFREVPLHLFGSLAIGRSQVIFRTPYLDNELVELAYRAPPDARFSATPSLRAVESLSPQLARIPTDRGVAAGQGRLMAMARHAGAAFAFKLDYLDKEGLPGRLWPLEGPLALLRRTPLMGQHKYLAYRGWFRSELREYLAATLAHADELDEFVDPAWRRTAVQRHAAGRDNLLRPISIAITLAAVQRLFLSVPHGYSTCRA